MRMEAETAWFSARARVVTADTTLTSPLDKTLPPPPTNVCTVGGLDGGAVPIVAVASLTAADPTIDPATFSPWAMTTKSTFDRTVTVAAWWTIPFRYVWVEPAAATVA